MDSAEGPTAIEMKSGATFHPEWLAGIRIWWRHTAGARRNRPGLVYGGDSAFWFEDTAVLGWRDAFAQERESV